MSSNLLDNVIATSYGRRFGKTTAICKAAKEIGATVICADSQQAKMVAQEHGVKTAVIHQNLRGTTGPYLYDHLAMERTVFELDHHFTEELKRKDIQINTITTLHNLLEMGYENLNESYKELFNKYTKLKKRKKRKNVRK